MRLTSLAISFIVLLLFLGGCEGIDRQAPEVAVSVYPPFGDAQTVFMADASATRDNASESWQLQIRWDMESDGIWETGFEYLPRFAWKYPRNGHYMITCEVIDGSGNLASTQTPVRVMEVLQDSVMTDFRDGKVYKTTFIYHRWWMAENLRFGDEIVAPALPKDNGHPELYGHPDHPEYGGFYNWDEATHYLKDVDRGICPDGWRLPTPADVNDLLSIAYTGQHLDDFMAPGGSFGLDLQLSGRYIRPWGIWDGATYRGNFWLTDPSRIGLLRNWAFYRVDFVMRPIYEGTWGVPGIEGWAENWGDFNYSKVALPVRCVKD